jgi:hypothetical protein
MLLGIRPPKIVVTSIIFLQLLFLVMYEHHILNYFLFLKVCLIKLKLNLINYLKKSNKQWKTWMYGVYLWQNNTCHIVYKNCIYTSKLRLWVEFLGEFFFMVYDIDIHELNLRPLRYLKFLDEISLKNLCFFHFWTINAW